MLLDAAVITEEDDLATFGVVPVDEDGEETPQRVFLPTELWEQLSEIAKFESDIRKTIGLKAYSRAKLLRFVLSLYVREYWPGVGGRPTSKAEWKRMAKREADRRLAEREGKK